MQRKKRLFIKLHSGMDDLESFFGGRGGSIEGDSVQCRCQFPLHPPQSFFRVKEKDAERGSEFVDSNIRG